MILKNLGAYIILLISMNKNHLREVAQHRHWLPDLLTLRLTSLCSGSTKLLSQVCLSPRMVGPFRNRPIQISAQTTSPNQSSPEPQFWWSWCPVLFTSRPRTSSCSWGDDLSENIVRISAWMNQLMGTSLNSLAPRLLLGPGPLHRLT